MLAALVRAGAARVTRATRLEHFHRDAVAGNDAPLSRRDVADALDDTNGLVPGDEREPGGQVPGVLLVVGAAQPARLDAKQRVVLTGGGDCDLARDQFAWFFEHERAPQPSS
jgi:hypothetical protein